MKLELATYNRSFKWISGAQIKQRLSFMSGRLTPEKKPTTINMLFATHSDEPAFNTRSRTTQQHSSNVSTPKTDAAAPAITKTGTLHHNLCQQIDWKHFYKWKSTKT